MSGRLQPQLVYQEGAVQPNAFINRNLSAISSSIAGPDSKTWHRYCAALIVHVRGEWQDGGAAVEPTTAELANALMSSISWTRFGGVFCENLTGAEVFALMQNEGIIGPDKWQSMLWKAVGDNAAVEGIFVLPYAPRAFVGGGLAHKRALDGVFPHVLLGNASEVKYRCGVLPSTWECAAGYDVTFMTASFDSSDVILPRCTSWNRLLTADDPAVLSGTLMKVDNLFAMAADDDTDVGIFASLASEVRVKVDGMQVFGEGLSYDDLHAFTRSLRDDSSWFRTNVNWPTIAKLIDPYIADRLTNYPVGSRWTVEGLGRVEGASLRYLWRKYTEASQEQIARAASMMGVDARQFTDSRLSINGKELAKSSYTETEALGLPVRVDYGRVR